MPSVARSTKPCQGPAERPNTGSAPDDRSKDHGRAASTGQRPCHPPSASAPTALPATPAATKRRATTHPRPGRSRPPRPGRALTPRQAPAAPQGRPRVAGEAGASRAGGLLHRPPTREKSDRQAPAKPPAPRADAARPPDRAQRPAQHLARRPSQRLSQLPPQRQPKGLPAHGDPPHPRPRPSGPAVTPGPARRTSGARSVRVRPPSGGEGFPANRPSHISILLHGSKGTVSREVRATDPAHHRS